MSEERRERWWMTPALVGGVVVVAALMGFSVFVATGIDTEVRDVDRGALITAATIQERFAPETPWTLEREVFKKQQLRAVSCELEYTYDDVADSGVLIDHLIVRDSDAASIYAAMERGMAQLEAQGLREEAQEAPPKWGEATRLGLVYRGDAPAAWRFLGVRGEWVVQLVIGGGELEQPAFEAIVADALARLDQSPPCAW